MIKKIIKDIRFWILIFFIIRLVGIMDPPLEMAHNWRQVTGAMVSRNFLEVDASIIYPRVDMAGERSGITGTEFPFLNYLVYMVSLLFGFQEGWGRLLNLVVSSFGIFYFYKIIKRWFEEDVAFNAAIILLSSIWFMYSRKLMPDTFSVSLVLIGSYWGLQYIDKGKWYFLFVAFLSITLGILSKIPAGFITGLFLFILIDKNVSHARKVIFSSVLFFAFIFCFIWYFIWVPHLVKQYGYWHYYMGTPFRLGVIQLYENTQEVLKKFYFEGLKFSGFIVFIGSLIMAIIKKEKNILFPFLLFFVLFCVFVAKAGEAFAKHSYYIIPFVPVMAWVVGWGLSRIQNKRWSYVLIFLISIEGIANQQHDFFIKDTEKHKLSLEYIADSVSEKNDLVAFNCGRNPQQLYFTHRKGWVFENGDFNNDTIFDFLINHRCTHLFIDKKMDVSFQYPIVFENSNYKVYRLIPK